MRNLEEDNQSNKHLVVGSIEVLEDISGAGVKTIKQSIQTIDQNLNTAIAQQNDFWSQLSSDRTISPVEKKTIYKEYQSIQNTYLSIMATAETLGYLSDVEITEYKTAYEALTTYLQTTLKLFDNLEEATNISSRANFNGYFTNYYDKEFRARVLLSKGRGGGYQDYQFAVGELDDYPTEDTDWHDAPPVIPAGKYLWCRTRWVDPEGYAGQWYTFRIQGTNGSYHDYQFAQGTKDEYPTQEAAWTDAPPTIQEGYYLWSRERYVNTNGEAGTWHYFRIDGANGGWQDTQFAAGELTTYPTSEDAWTDAPPVIPETKYLWQRTRWIQDDQVSEWTYTRLQGAAAGYQDYQFAVGTINGFLINIFINGKQLIINNSRLAIEDPNNEGEWHDAPPEVPAGFYLWCRTRWVDENGDTEEWHYFRMSGANGGYQDYMFAAGDLTTYPTSEDAWTDGPPAIPEGKYLWQRTRWYEEGKDPEAWTYTRISGPAGGYQDYQFAAGDLTVYPQTESDWHDAPPTIPEGKYLWQRTRWTEEGQPEEQWTYTRISGPAGGYQDYQFAAGDLDDYPTSEDAWTDAPPAIPEGKYLWTRTRWVEDGKDPEAWTYTRLSGAAGGYQDYQFAEGELTTYPTEDADWHDAPPTIATGKYLWQRTRWTEEGQPEEQWTYTRISGSAGGYQDYMFAAGDLTTYPTEDTDWHDAPPTIPAEKYLWQRTRWVEDGKPLPEWTYTRISGTAGGYQNYEFAAGDLTTYPITESAWHDAPPTIPTGKYLWQRTRWEEDGKNPEAWTYTRISGEDADNVIVQFSKTGKSGTWHTDFQSGDYYMHISTDGGDTWTKAAKIVGENAPEVIVMFSSDASDWHTDFAPGDYYMQVSSDGGNTWTKAAKIVGENAPEVLTKYSVTGEDGTWHDEFTDGDLYMIISTDDGVTWTDPPARIVGEAAPRVIVQFSKDTYSWDESFIEGDIYMRISTDNGDTWTDPAKIVGEDAPEVLTEYSVTGTGSWHPEFTDGDLYMRLSTDNGDTWTDPPARIVGEAAPEVIVKYSSDAYSWHEGFVESDIYMIISTDGGETWTDPPARIVGEDAPEVLTKYSVTGEDGTWHDEFTDGDLYMILSTDGGLTWTDPPARIVGEAAPEMKTKYSIDGTGNWHFPYEEGDLYMIISTDGGNTWGDPIRVVGENAPATLAMYSVDGKTDWHPKFVDGDYYMKLSVDGGITWGDAIQIVGEDGQSVYAQYSQDGKNWHNPPFQEGDLYMRTSSDGQRWGSAARIVAEATDRYIGGTNKYIDPKTGTYFLAIADFKDTMKENIIINNKTLIINNKTLAIQQQIRSGNIYKAGEDLKWTGVFDRNDWRYLVALNDLHKYGFELSPEVEDIFNEHLEPIEEQLEEHAGEITVINNQLVVIDNNLAAKLDAADYHIPINKGSLMADPQDAGEGDFYVYVGVNGATRKKSNVYVYTNGEWIEKDPTSSQDGAYYMACLNQILNANSTDNACFAAVFAASMYANTAWLNEVHSSIIHISEYGKIETDNYQAGATFSSTGIEAAAGGVGFCLQDADSEVPAYMDMNGYAHFGNDVLIDGNMKATNADISGKINASELKLSQSCTVGENLTIDQDGKITANKLEVTNADISGKINASELKLSQTCSVGKNLTIDQNGKITGKKAKLEDIEISGMSKLKGGLIQEKITWQGDIKYLFKDLIKRALRLLSITSNDTVIACNGIITFKINGNIFCFRPYSIEYQSNGFYVINGYTEKVSNENVYKSDRISTIVITYTLDREEVTVGLTCFGQYYINEDNQVVPTDILYLTNAYNDSYIIMN